MESKKVQRYVSDLGSSAYLLMKGYKPQGRNGKDIVFMIEDPKWRTFEELKIEYLSSEFHRFDSCLMSLKKMGEYQPEDHDSRHTVGDLGAGAYLMMHGFKPVGREGKNILFEVLESEESDFDEKQLEYLSSDYHRFDSCIMSLKKINPYSPK